MQIYIFWDNDCETRMLITCQIKIVYTLLPKIARPRFELGSKAPKASMLVRYIRYLGILPGFSGHFIIKFTYNIILLIRFYI